MRPGDSFNANRAVVCQNPDTCLSVLMFADLTRYDEQGAGRGGSHIGHAVCGEPLIPPAGTAGETASGTKWTLYHAGRKRKTPTVEPAIKTSIAFTDRSDSTPLPRSVVLIQCCETIIFTQYLKGCRYYSNYNELLVFELVWNLRCATLVCLRLNGCVHWLAKVKVRHKLWIMLKWYATIIYGERCSLKFCCCCGVSMCQCINV